MGKCNCIEQSEKNIIEHLKKQNPDKTYDEDLNRFDDTGFRNTAFSFGGNGGIKFYHEFAIKSTFTKKNGEQSNPKREVINIYPTYCSFCGIKLESDEKH